VDRRRQRNAIAFVLFLALGIVASSSFSQAIGPSTDPGPALDMAPFGPGEKATYQVKLGGIGVGSGTMEVTGMEEVDGHSTYHASLHVTGGFIGVRVNTKMDTWLDEAGLFSRRFEQDQNEFRYHRYRMFDFYPEKGTYQQRGSDEVQQLASDQPLDDVAFLYYARTLPLVVGDSYTIPRYFKDDGNPVVIKVLRKETIKVPAGTFNTIVVQPIIQTDGLFGQGGRAEVFFSDDERRLLVHMSSRVPVVGSLSLHLRSYEPGTPTRTPIR
jgi:hypothetical protein